MNSYGMPTADRTLDISYEMSLQHRLAQSLAQRLLFPKKRNPDDSGNPLTFPSAPQLICFRAKCLDKCWMDCHAIWCRCLLSLWHVSACGLPESHHATLWGCARNSPLSNMTWVYSSQADCFLLQLFPAEVTSTFPWVHRNSDNIDRKIHRYL